MIFVLNSGVYFFFGMIFTSVICMYLIYHTRLFFQGLVQFLVSIILFLANNEVRYNCTLIDLHDRSVVASITDRNITSDLAIRTLKKSIRFSAQDTRRTDFA